MARLIRDRYYEYALDQAWDLATGENVSVSDLRDDLPRDRPSLAPLAEVLEHGRDGVPRWIVADAPVRRGYRVAVQTAAEEARARGFVPIAADVYLRLRAVLAGELRDRALVLIARPAVPLHVAKAALMDAAARSARPHVLLTFRSPAASKRGHGTPRTVIPSTRGSGYLVHEARAVYGAQPARAAGHAPLPDDVLRHVGRASRAAGFVRAGRHAAAERLLRDVAGALVRRRAFTTAAETYVSLGRLFLERGRAADAETAFDQAVVQAEAAHEEPAALGARIWQAAARTDLAQLTAAESLARAVLLTGTVSEAERARAEATLARVLLWQGRVDEARALGFVTGSCAEGHGTFVRATAIRLLLECGRVFEAGQRCRDLLTFAESSADPLERAIALSAQMRVLVSTGDLVLVHNCLAQLQDAARAARSPLRLARARLLWVDALRRAGRSADAARELQVLARIRAAVPPLLRAEIDRRVRGSTAEPRFHHSQTVTVPSAATSLVAIAQREDDDRKALTGLFEFSARALKASRLDLWSADAGPDSVVLSVGTGLPTRLGPRALEAGITVGPDQDDPGHEVGIPVRLGARLLAAIAIRWPADRTQPSDAAGLLSLTAAVAAPRVESLLAAGRAASHAATAIPELVGSGAAIAAVRQAVVRAAAAPFAVLIAGESGVGKELVARAIHQLGPRRERRFCDVNCAALPDDLLESELFGHARGAFTGAVADRTGLFEEADGGTLFLDEVIDLSPRAQAKLLRVLQQHEVRRVGEMFSRKVDVRVVSAANRDLHTEAATGRFRQDLLYRLEVIRIHIPPLRERPEDIPLLADHFWREAAARVGTSATLTHPVLTALSRYHWPGNVRELQNVIAALAVEAPTRGHVRPTLLPRVITGVSAVTSACLADARAQFERRFVEVALARAGGSRTRAARELGLSRQGLLKLLARLGMVQ